MSKEKLLEEYIKIHDEITEMKNKFERLRFETKIKLKYAINEKQKDQIMSEFDEHKNTIKHNSNLKEKYNSLMSKKEKIKKQIISGVNNTEIDSLTVAVTNDNKQHSDTISDLLNKYKKNTTESIPVVSNTKSKKLNKLVNKLKRTN